MFDIVDETAVISCVRETGRYVVSSQLQFLTNMLTELMGVQ